MQPNRCERSVLIVAPYFAPQSHAAVFRAYKIAKLLPTYGWRPFVLTVDKNYLYNEDPGLLESLPPEVDVQRALYIEPTARGVRMALGGEDRSFTEIKGRGELNSASPEGTASGFGTSTLNRVYRYLLKNWIQVPDAYWTWYWPALQQARNLISRHRIPIVFTCANPYTVHQIGRALKHDGVQWVADLRDPHTYCHHMHSDNPRVFGRQRAAERSAVKNADAVTVASSAISMILTDSYGLSRERRIDVIATGLDESLLPASGEKRVTFDDSLVFAGEFLPDYGPEFLEIFAESLKNPKVRQTKTQLQFIGRREVNEKIVRPHLQKFGLESRAEFIDHLPQQHLYRRILKSKAAVLISGRKFRWWCLFAKLVDYIALRKRVIAIVPDPSEARSRLEKTGLGVFLDGDVECCAEILSKFLIGKLELPRPNEKECDKYLASHQVQQFADVFERLL